MLCSFSSTFKLHLTAFIVLAANLTNSYGYKKEKSPCWISFSTILHWERTEPQTHGVCYCSKAPVIRQVFSMTFFFSCCNSFQSRFESHDFLGPVWTVNLRVARNKVKFFSVASPVSLNQSDDWQQCKIYYSVSLGEKKLTVFQKFNINQRAQYVKTNTTKE